MMKILGGLLLLGIIYFVYTQIVNNQTEESGPSENSGGGGGGGGGEKATNIIVTEGRGYHSRNIETPKLKKIVAVNPANVIHHSAPKRK